jgi:hypothetical protein
MFSILGVLKMIGAPGMIRTSFAVALSQDCLNRRNSSVEFRPRQHLALDR